MSTTTVEQLKPAEAVEVYAEETDLKDYPLHKAARSGNVSKVKKVLAENPDCINSKDSEGNTALHWAVGHIPVVRTLIEAGADREAQNTEGHQPMHYARFKLVRALLNGEDVPRVAPVAATPLAGDAAAQEPKQQRKQPTRRTQQDVAATTSAVAPTPAQPKAPRAPKQAANAAAADPVPVPATTSTSTPAKPKPANNNTTTAPATTTTTGATVAPVTAAQNGKPARQPKNKSRGLAGASADEETRVLDSLPDDTQLTAGMMKKILSEFKKQINTETRKMSNRFDLQVARYLRDNLNNNYGAVYSSPVELHNINDVRTYINKIAQHSNFGLVELEDVIALAKRYLTTYLGHLATSVQTEADKDECVELQTFLVDYNSSYASDQLFPQLEKLKNATLRTALDSVLQAHVHNDSEAFQRVLFDTLIWVTHPNHIAGGSINVGVSGRIVARQLSNADTSSHAIRLSITIGDIVPTLRHAPRTAALTSIKHALNLVTIVLKAKGIDNIEKNAIVYYAYDELNTPPREGLDALDAALQYSYVRL